MNIQPIGITQNRQQNFGLNYKWTAGLREHPMNVEDTEKTVNLAKNLVKRFIEALEPRQRAELNATLEELKDNPGTLEFHKTFANPKGDVWVNVLLADGEPRDMIRIEPSKIDGTNPLIISKELYIENTCSRIINGLKRLLPLKQAPEVSKAELLAKLDIDDNYFKLP